MPSSSNEPATASGMRMTATGRLFPSQGRSHLSVPHVISPPVSPRYVCGRCLLMTWQDGLMAESLRSCRVMLALAESFLLRVWRCAAPLFFLGCRCKHNERDWTSKTCSLLLVQSFFDGWDVTKKKDKTKGRHDSLLSREYFVSSFIIIVTPVYNMCVS